MDATAFVRIFGIKLQYERRLAKSPCGLLNCPEGLYLVQLEIIPKEGESYKHYVVYDAALSKVINNETSDQVSVVDEPYRKNNKTAVKIYFQLFPNAQQIQQLAVSRAV